MLYTDRNPWDCLDTFGKPHRKMPSQASLCQWPLKISMVPVCSPYFHKAHLLLAADCSAFSYRNFHDALLPGHILITGCPQTEPDLAKRLCDIIRFNDIVSVAVVRMDAPCCQPLTDAVIEALRKYGKGLSVRFTTIFAEGEIVSE